MSMNFPLILVSLTALTGVIWLLDSLFFLGARKRRQGTAIVKHPLIVEYSRSFFPVLLAVLVIRSFIVQPYRVPTGSLEPTILPGDFIAVNQFAYGLRLPVIGTKILNIGEPKRGDIVVFRWPVDPSIDFVKRVIGLPGDHVVYQNKILTINNQPVSQKIIGDSIDLEPSGNIPSMLIEENLLGVKHQILVHYQGGETGDFDFTVPKGLYFMMGDNRDESSDSRFWGLVPESALEGKAFVIWMSWDSQNHDIRWNRLGMVL